MDCFSSIIKFLLVVVNIIFLLVGLAVFILAAVLRWSSDFILGKFEVPELKDLIDLSSISSISVGLLVLGAFIIVLSIIGLIGACCNSRFFLVVYEIIIIALFLAHGIVLIVGAVEIGEVEKLYRQELNKTMGDLNNKTFILNNNQTAIGYCTAFKLLSELFECCGVNGPNVKEALENRDFNTTDFTKEKCCNNEANPSRVGCADKSWKILNDGVVNLIIIPNGAILGFELLIIVTVPILIKRMSKN